MKRAIILILVFLISISFSDWPRFLGKDGTGFSQETGINKSWSSKKPKILWKSPLSDRGVSGPSIKDGKVYILDHVDDEDVVRCYDLKSGRVIWEYKYPDANRQNYGFGRATPLIEGNRLYSLGREGDLVCLDSSTGKKIWHKHLKKDYGATPPQWKLAGSPIIDEDRLVIVSGGEKGLLTINKGSGALIWQGGNSDLAGYATPVVGSFNGVKQYIIFTGLGLIGVDVSSGKTLWKFPWTQRYNVNGATPLILSGDRVYLSSGYGHGSAMLKITGKSYKKLWESDVLQAKFSTPIHLNGYIYGVGEPGDFICMDAQTGKLKWKMPGFGFGSLIHVDGMFIVMGGKTGELKLVKPSSSKYIEISSIKPLGGQSWTAPILSNKTVILRNRNFIAAIDLS